MRIAMPAPHLCISALFVSLLGLPALAEGDAERGHERPDRREREERRRASVRAEARHTARLALIAEEELARTCKDFSAARGEVVVIDEAAFLAMLLAPRAE